jgi:transposase-like protein
MPCPRTKSIFSTRPSSRLSSPPPVPPRIAAHRAKLHSRNPIERLNGEVKRRTEMVGIFPNVDAVVRIVGGICWTRMTNGACSEAAK